jgi:hypothetical protein
MRFFNSFSGESFTASIPFKIDTILIDPAYWLISGNNITADVEEFELPDATMIYPNPSFDYITVSLNDPIYNFPFIIVAMEGTSVKQGSITQAMNRIDIRSLPCGLYSLVITGKNRSYMRTFIKNRE